MFRTIVVAHDGSRHAEDALALALRLRAPDGALVLATVTPLTPALVGPPALHHAGGETRARALSALETMADTVPGDVPVEVQVLDAAFTANGLSTLAAARGADLLVVGASHHGRPSRATGRTTVQRLLHHVPCALAMAPEGERVREAGPLRIGVAWDGTQPAENALETAFALAAETGGAVRVVRVVDPVMMMAGGLPLPDSALAMSEQEEEARGELEDAVGGAPAGVAVEALVVRGEAATRFLDETADLDLLVCGSRHHSLLHRAAVGSVSSKLLTHARRPVLVTQWPDEDV
jgi:nucleotide-binding universal stress UspA family protein